ncbi:MAG: NAD(P)-dependent oxidoreductase, partial [Rhodobacteraceae bacterium]|nr:NAD(P)-dependent oxidoreductase [Paracoccaceae bacterium]
MMKRLLITGAAGGLGAMCRERLTHLAETIVVSDRDGLGEAAAHE